QNPSVCIFQHPVRNLKLEFPDDIERDEVEPVCRVMPLQCCKLPAVITKGTGPCVHQRPPKAGCQVMIDRVLEPRAISQLAIYRQDGKTVRSRDWRTVIRKSC